MLTHQTQPCPVSCVSTCLAMLFDWPVELVKHHFHQRYRETSLTIGDMLREVNLPYTDFRTADAPGLADLHGFMLVGVPSLNIQGGMHQIVVEMNNEEMEWTVYDPNKGREGILYYSNQPNDPAEPLRVLMGGGYSIDCVISYEALAEWRAANPVPFVGEPKV